MVQYAIRVDIKNGSTDDIVRWCDRTGGAYLIVREGGDENPHVHVIMESDREIRILRQDLKRQLSWLAGNGDYSMATVRDTDKYERYCCKGDENSPPLVVARMGVRYSDSFLEERRNQYWQEQKDYKARQKRKGLHSATIVEKVEEVCKKEGIRWDKEREIGRVYLGLLSEGKKAVNTYQLRAVVRGVQLQLAPGDEAIDYLLTEAYGV